MALGINSNISGINANRFLGQSSNKVSDALKKLSSGLRINQAQDGPAALIISELLRSQTSGFQQAVRNTQEANNVLSIAEGGLQEVSGMLTRMRELAVSSLNSGITSSSQTSANQAELNGMLSTVQHIASTTSFSGQNLLNGSQGITYTANDPDGLVNLNDTSINEIASVGQDIAISFSGDAADQAEKAVLETDFAAASATAQQFTITGETGSAEFRFSAGTSVQEMADAINNKVDSTGVSAYVFNDGTTDQLRLTSQDYGSDQAIRVEQEIGNAFATAGEAVNDFGQNAVVTVNGQRVEANGLDLELQTSDVSGTIRLNEGDPAGTAVAQTGYDQATLTDASTSRSAGLNDMRGGMQFQLGEGAGSQNRQTFGIGSVDPANIGKVEIDGETYSLSDLYGGGKASLANNPEAAIKVIDQAIQDISSQRASIGAYQANTLETNVNSLQVAIENITATESAIRDADMAKEISELIKSQILEKSGLMGVQSSNLNAQNVLKLLGG